MQGIKERPFYTRIALTGIGMILFVAAVLAIAILIFEPEAILFPIMVAVPALIIGALIYFVRPWGLIFGVLGGLFALLIATDGIDLTLAQPGSFFEFILPLFMIPAALLIAGGSITGLVKHFRGTSESANNPTLTMAIKGMLGVVAVLAVVSFIITIAGTGDVSADEQEGATTIEAHHAEFNVETLKGKKVLFDNKDPILHTFTIRDQDVDVVVGPWRQKVFDVDLPAGDYYYYCRVSGHEDMDGTLTVQ